MLTIPIFLVELGFKYMTSFFTKPVEIVTYNNVYSKFVLGEIYFVILIQIISVNTLD
eukprot:GAHX01005441.1.p1 GENE.GAHX01005441.1~~GAHX01005441.1.p1  ORF type:complete len:57 (+),score=0.50 GAHX01005441.1:382-552(+)